MLDRFNRSSRMVDATTSREFTSEQQARLVRINALAEQLSEEMAAIERENHREALRVYRGVDPGNWDHPSIRRLKATEHATFNARSLLQGGLMWMRRATTQTERF